ncbi:MAG: preprotein translocase subunit SecG [Verrucomicrobiota bacterium]|nr:preprotein translocase subunit SecG [Verrucomicrobiota bacterium]
MGAILLTLFTLVLIILSFFLVLVILMQRASANAGMGSAFGSGFSENAMGAEAGNILTKATIWGAGLFFVLTLGLYLGYKAEHEASKLSTTPKMDEVIKILPAAAASTEATATTTTTVTSTPSVTVETQTTPVSTAPVVEAPAAAPAPTEAPAPAPANP